MDDGYIKFICTLLPAPPPNSVYLQKLNSWRNQLHRIGLIGKSDDGVGFGNISRRYKTHRFIISGSATGGNSTLSLKDYVTVTKFNIHKNSLLAQGLIQPSSESMTHGIIYQTLPGINYIIHVHSADLWHRYKNIFPTTAEHVAYGTPSMAMEVKRIILTVTTHHPQVIVMGGHTDGLIVYGSSLEDTGKRLLAL